MSVVGIIIDGEARLYTRDGAKIVEYGRIGIERATTHEELARFAFDLLAFTHAEPEPEEATPATPKRVRALPRASIADGTISGRVARAIEAHGPLTLAGIREHVSGSPDQIRGAASSLVQRKVIRYGDGGYMLIKSLPPNGGPPARPRPRRRATKPAGREHEPWIDLVYGEIERAERPINIIEIAERLGITGARNPISSALTSLVGKGVIETAESKVLGANGFHMYAYRVAGGGSVRQEESGPSVVSEPLSSESPWPAVAFEPIEETAPL